MPQLQLQLLRMKSFSAFFVANAVRTPIDGVGVCVAVLMSRDCCSDCSAWPVFRTLCCGA